VIYIINDLSQIGPLISDISNHYGPIGLDTETSGLDWITCKLYTIQLYVGGNTYVFNCLKFKQIEYLVHLINTRTLVGHNIKFDTKVLLAKTGVLLTNVYDTMLAEVLINQGLGKKFYSLAELVQQYYGVDLSKEVRASFYELGELFELTDEQLTYAANDVQYLTGIRDSQLEKLATQNQTNVLDLEMRLVPVIAKMEHKGVGFDRVHWEQLMNDALAKAKLIGDNLKAKIIDEYILTTQYDNVLQIFQKLEIPVKTKRLTTQLETMTDSNNFRGYILDNINLSSPKQMLAILHVCGVDTDSTNEKDLKESFSKHPIVSLLLEYREWIKKSTSFGESFLSKIHPSTERIHAEFNQLMADTGRFSCSNPNLQQIVRDSEYRHCFIASPGKKMVTVDYSQQELRLAGAITGEPKFIEAYQKNLDLHTITASLMYGVPVEQVTKDQRQVAKGYNFAVLYGSTEYGLAYNFQMDIKEARGLLDKYYEGYDRLHRFKIAMEDAIFEKKYSSTPLGRKRFFEAKEFFTDGKEYEKYRNAIKRQGFNQMIQGAGADVTKTAIVMIHEENPFGDKLELIMSVHDEIVCEVDECCLDEAVEFITAMMKKAEQPYLKDIPAEVGQPAIDNYWSK
jgi:DNA polymerase I-like protein with 3'-5' exonuclease and polymerase domains